MSSKSSISDRGREAKLEQIRRQNAADKRRQRIIAAVTGGIIVVLAAVVGVVIYQASQDKATAAGADPTNTVPVTYVAPKDKDGKPIGDGDGNIVNGFAVGPADAPATVTIFEDYQCPACKQFEQALGTYVAGLPAAGVRVVYHPVAILDRQSNGTKYSSRTASAAACIAQSDDADLTVFKAWSTLMFANQPAEGTTGLETSQVAAFATQAGASEEVVTCINDESFMGWAERATAEASAAGLNATPTIWVNGTPVPSEQISEQGLQALIDAAGGAAVSPSDAASVG